MNAVNAYETWSLYDTVVIASNADELWNGQGMYKSYKDLGVPPSVPFFNARNKSAGVQYCNLDSANKLPYVFHCYSMGISFESPNFGGSGILESPGSQGRTSNLFF